MLSKLDDDLQFCVEPGCWELKKPGRARCPGHHTAQQRAYRVGKAVQKRQEAQGQLKATVSELALAIALCAAYGSGYRHGVGDRAIMLWEQRREERELARVRESGYGKYPPY